MYRIMKVNWNKVTRMPRLIIYVSNDLIRVSVLSKVVSER